MTPHALRIEILGQENGLLTLISGVLMTILAFWTAGQFFVEKAYGSRKAKRLLASMPGRS
jgi:hypothetical protein